VVRNIHVRICCLVLSAFLSLVASADLAVKNKELVALTANASIWEGDATSFSRKFSLLDWEEVEDGKEYRAKGLTLWGQPVEAVRIKEVDGLVKMLSFEILGQETSLALPIKAFNQSASRWKVLLDKKLASKGKTMPKMMAGTMKHTRMAWKNTNSIIILTSHVDVTADRLVLNIYEKKLGLAQFKRKGQQNKDLLPEKIAGENENPVPIREKAEIKKIIRDILARKSPSGISHKVQDAVNLLNVYRYLSSVPYDVQADTQMITAAEDAAGICNKKKQLSHDLGHFTEKCNLAMNTASLTMENSVTQYMDDSGDNNRARRGHRRWCINHRMGKTGFGLVGAYSAMYSMDSSGSSTRKNYSYPGHGFYPIKYLHGNGWSYHLVDGNAPAGCEVKVWKLKSKDDKLPRWSQEPNGRALPVNYVNTNSNMIIFEPQDKAVTKKGCYLVRIKGNGLKEQYLVKLF